MAIPNKWLNVVRVSWFAGWTCVLACGCSERWNKFEITNYRGIGDVEYFHETFDECFYSLTPDNNLDLVLRLHTPAADSGDEIGSVTQIIHVRTLFNTIPGRTYADRTMINGVVNYTIVSDHGGACYEGAGFLYCEKSNRTGELTGELELAKLRPNRRAGSVGNIFDRAEICGEFKAYPDRKRVVTILNELDRVFGLQPRYQPPDHPDPM